MSFTYYSTRTIQTTLRDYEHTGTVFGAVNKSQFEALRVIEPDSSIVDAFDSCARPLDARIKSNTRESRDLAALRDTLLPNLISGELRVRGAKRLDRENCLVSAETLTSLAMLKVHVDQGQDYLDYLRPFILQVLVAHTPDPVTDAIVRDLIRADFGLEIPDRAVQVMLKRLSRRVPVEEGGYGVYRITGDLPDPRINVPRKADAIRHIEAVISDLVEFSKGTAKPIGSHDEAVTAICAFLTRFNIPCLRAYLRGTAIPTIEGQHHSQIVLVSKYVLTLQNTNLERFESFLVVVKGHMLANALLCPDLKNAPKSYKGVTFYLDTPLLVRQLGLEEEPKQAAINNLVTLVLSLGATVATFSHSRAELESVITKTAQYIESPNGRGAIVTEARRHGTTKSDLLVLAGQIDDKLKDARIDVLSTPRYVEGFQIDETAFEEVLGDEVSYLNPHAKEYDINSVRSIYVLRAGTSPTIVERSKAALVTSNVAFSRAAFQYGQKHEESRKVSSVITDFSLANMAWLKAPLGAPAVPMTELLAFSYAALEPSSKLLEKYLGEIDKLEKQGKITARDHQLLRSSQLAQTELMNLTLGEEDALTEQTVTETLRPGDGRDQEGGEQQVQDGASGTPRDTEAACRTAHNQEGCSGTPILALPTASHSVRVVCVDNHCWTAYWWSYRGCWCTTKRSNRRMAAHGNVGRSDQPDIGQSDFRNYCPAAPRRSAGPLFGLVHQPQSR